MVAQRNLGLEAVASRAAGHAVDGHAVAGPGLAGDANRQRVGGLLAVPVVQDGPRERLEDFQRGGVFRFARVDAAGAPQSQCRAARGRLQNTASA